MAAFSSGNVSGFSEYTVQNPNSSSTPSPNVALSGTEDTGQGLFILYGLNASGFQAGGDYGYYPIDANRLIAVQVNGKQTGQQAS